MLQYIFLQAVPAIADTTKKVAQATTATAVEKLSLLDLLVKGGIVMIPLLILSLITIYYIVKKWLDISNADKTSDNFTTTVAQYLKNGQIDTAASLCKTTNGIIPAMLDKGILQMGKPTEYIEKAMESTGKLQLSKVEQGISVLAIVASIAPIFGFIGTILGVIQIFYNISLTDNISIGAISGGLYTKMVTSATGLIIGLLAYLGYHLLQIRLDKLIFKMDSSVNTLIDTLQSPSK